MDAFFDGLREFTLAIIFGISGGVWWVVKKLLAHDASFTLMKQSHEAAFDIMKQEIRHNREVTNEIRSDVKLLLSERRE